MLLQQSRCRNEPRHRIIVIVIDNDVEFFATASLLLLRYCDDETAVEAWLRA